MDRIVISHWDLDGIVGATIINRRLRVTKTYLASVTALVKYLEESVKKIKYGGEIWITDLNPQVSDADRLSEILKEARRKHARIYWIDHHEWSRRIYDTIIGYQDILYYRVDPNTTASDLVARYFDLTDDEYFSKLIDLAYDDDFFLNKYPLTTMWRRVLRWYKWPTRYKTLSSFIQGEIRPAWMIDLYKRIKNVYENLIRAAIASTDIIVTRNNIRLLVFPDVDPRVHPGELVYTAKINGLLADIYIIRYPRGISLRSDYIDVAMIARMLGGGGHRRAAGIPGLTNIEKLIEIITYGREEHKDFMSQLI